MKKVLSILLVTTLIISIIPTGLFSITASAETSEVYTITYHLDGGANALKNPDVYTEDDVITLMDATKVGYDFVGWFLDENMTEQIAEISNMTGNIELYAKFAAKSYIGVFHDNGATSSSSICIKLYNSFGQTKEVSLNNGDVFDPYSYWAPSCSGYVFLGWYNNSELVSGPLEISQDLSLEAKWSKCEQTNNDGILGVSLNSITVKPNINYDERSDSAYVYIPADVTTVHYEGLSVRRDVYYLNQYKTTIYGDFVIYDVTRQICLVDGSKGGYGQKSGDLTVAPGTLLRITASSGYAAVNLGYYATGECSLTAGKLRSSNITVPNQRQIEQKFDSMINAPTVNKEGYRLLGWYDSQENQMTDTWQYTEDKTFTARWELLNYDINYELDGGVNNASNPTTYTIEDTIALKDPTKSGYTFKGWYSDANFTTQVTSISKKAQNITLYAKWAVNSYNLILNANGGGFAPKVTFVSDGEEIKNCYLYEQDTITAYRPDDKEGYIFAGWYTDDTFTSLFKFNGTIANDIILYAKWVECVSNIVNVESMGSINTTIQGKTEQLYAFVPLVDGEMIVTSESNNLDLCGTLYDATKNALISADDISSTDLDFTYTYSVNAGQLYYISVKGNTASTAGQAVINIRWTGNCTITGATYQNREVTVIYDTNFKLPQKPVQEGYVFLGWFDESDMQITDGIWNFATDKTLTAKWEEATYHTVVFKDLDGNIISSDTYYLTEDIVAPQLPTKDSDEIYRYHAKWDNEYTGVCTGDAVYSPIFEPEYIEYTVVFVDENGTELSRGTYHWGDVVTAPANPTKDVDETYANAYTFSGWNQPVVNCAGNTTYTATYTAIPLNELILTSQPNKVRYHVGESLDVTGIALQLVYSDDLSIFLESIDAQFASADLSVAGRKIVTITIAGVSTQFEIYVHDVKEEVVLETVGPWLYPQSSHDYSNNMDETKIFIYPGAQSLVITFNSRTSVENGYDYIYVYDGTGNQIAKYTGTTAANKTLTITGDTFKVRLTSDSSIVQYGYAFSIITANVNTYEIIHQPVIDPATVTCTQNGLTEGSHCDICGDILVAQEEVAAYGHEYETVFSWSSNHTSCSATITCARDCGLHEVVDCTVTHSGTNRAQTTHTAVAECDGKSFTDVMTCNNFLITFKNWNDTQLSSTYYHVGDVVTVPTNPTRATDQVGTYTFKGWDKTVVNCAGNATYTATYTITYTNYTVVFKDWDGTVLSTKTYHYGDTVTSPSNPSRAADNTYTYTFNGWDKTVVNCTSDTSYTATYTSNYINYTVVFKNYNGAVLSTKTYHYGDAVTAPTTPTKPADGTYTYSFAGWDSNITSCTGNKVYTATFTSNYIDYTVIFKNYDGTILSSKTYHYGNAVTAPNNPIKPEDDEYTYTFAGWDSSVVACSGNKTYTATFDSIRKYVVGDIDGIEGVTDADAEYLLMFTFFPEDYPVNQTCDFNGDGFVNDADAEHLLMYTFFPEDYPLH